MTSETASETASAAGEMATGQPRPDQKESLLRRLGVLAGLTGLYTLVGCLALWPVPLEPHTRIIGGGELGGWLWRYWLMKLELGALWVELRGHPLEFFLQMISLGRFPETGNVADLFLISWPLDALFGHPTYYNLKCLLILVLNGLAGYSLSRHFTPDRRLATVGGLVAAFNTFVSLELYESGLRQAILWWPLLSVLYLERVIERGRLRDGLLGGVCFGLTAGFYWFYAVFLGMYALVRGVVAAPALLRGARLKQRLLSTALLIGVAGAIAYVFAYPYIYIQTDHTGALPEVQWFTSFPSVEALENAPKFPQTLEENLLSSLARVLISSWTLDYLWNPLHPRNVPAVLLLVAGFVGLLRVRREWFWVLVAIFFWLHTGGPYLQDFGLPGEHRITRFDGEPLRLPYAYTFQFVPVMSRLFAPYRSGAFLWIALMVLAVRNLEALRLRLKLGDRPFLLVLVGFSSLYLGQQFLDHRVVGWLGGTGYGLSGRGLPVDNSLVGVHPFYEILEQEPGQLGIIELPVRVQQDLVNYYQSLHHKKLFKGWAVPGALPPGLRFKHHSKHPETQALMWLVEPDTPLRNSFAEALEQLNQSPYVLGDYDPADREALGARGFKYVILHERGCYLLWPDRGKDLYDTLKRRLAIHLGEAHEFVELIAPEDPEFGQIEAGVLGEWASSAVHGKAGLVTRFHMTVFRMPGYAPPIPHAAAEPIPAPQDTGNREPPPAEPGSGPKGPP